LCWSEKDKHRRKQKKNIINFSFVLAPNLHFLQLRLRSKMFKALSLLRKKKKPKARGKRQKTNEKPFRLRDD